MRFFINLVNTLVGKYGKQVLTRIEEMNILTPEQYRSVRKAVLDGFNDFGREFRLTAEKREQ
jgi:hypothetical protein